MTNEFGVALFNYEAGGLSNAGGYEFERLQYAFADVTEVPSLILLCEAKEYRTNANIGLHGAAEALSDELGVAYVGLLGTSRRGPMPPAIFYNPLTLILRSWWGPDDPGAYDDKINVARFAIRDSGPIRGTRSEFLAWVDHWHPSSGIIRRQEAARLGRYGGERLPVIGGGDLNGTASGPHLPQRDWTAANYLARSGKGRQFPDGRWVADTAAVDHLIGSWDPQQQRRVDGCGFHAVAELAWHTDAAAPLLATVNDKPAEGGGLLIDWLLVNDVMRPHVVAPSYRVHVPPAGRPAPSDHRLVTATITL